MFINNCKHFDRESVFWSIELRWITQRLLSCFGAVMFFLALLAAFNAQSLEAGDRALDFRLPILTRLNEADSPAQFKESSLYRVVSLSDYLGTMVYVDFWASYCLPCRKSFPALSKLRDRFDRQTFEVLAISNDFNPKESLRFIKAYQATFPVLSDPTGLIAKKYGVEALPKGFLIDAKGRVLLVHEGFQSEDIHDILAPVLEFSSRHSE